MRSRALAIVLVLTVGVLAAPATVHAGVIAAVTVNNEAVFGDFDVVLFDPFDATRTFSLPAGVTTPGTEEQPFLTQDGSRLLFTRAGTEFTADKLFLVDRAAGTVSEVPLGATRGLALSPDGRTVVVARSVGGNPPNVPFPTSAGGSILDTTTLPAGPFPSLLDPVVDLPDIGTDARFAVVDARGTPDVNNDRRYVWHVEADPLSVLGGGRRDYLISGIVGGNSRATLVPSNGGNLAAAQLGNLANPVLTPGQSSTITFDDDNGTLGQVLLDATPSFDRLVLPNVTLTGGNRESEPTWSRSGRYLAWIDEPFSASSAPVPVKVFVYDTQTQQLVRSAGRSLGDHRFGFGLTIAETPSTVSTFALSSPVLAATATTALTLRANLRLQTSVGILVQRVTGTTRLLGRRVARLRTVGRVPLGPRRKGANAIPWNGRVNGRRLTPGTYRISMRSIARDGQPSDLSRPVTLRVR